MQPELNIKIGIIAGSGDLPETLINSCKELNRDVSVISLDSNKSHPKSLSTVPHQILNIAAVGKAIKFLKSQNIQDIVFAGGVKRPSFTRLRPDTKGIRLLTRILTANVKGDNSLLSIIIKFFEEEGFKIRGADEIVEDLLIPAGKIGKYEPDDKALEDIKLGIKIAKTMGSLDVGQSVIVQNGTVLGVEAIEGTDALIDRCKDLKLEGNGPILVKVKKPNQDRRIDLPTIGINTIEMAKLAGLQGIAIEAQSTLVLNKKEIEETADKLGMFVVGV